MEFKKKIFVVAGLVFLMRAPAAFAWIPYSSNLPAERANRIHPFELSQKSIVLAENDEPRAAESGGQPRAAESGGQSAGENKDQAPGSETADSEKSGNNPEDTAARSIKPFKPSEEIAAEQAVDFPVDI